MSSKRLYASKSRLHANCFENSGCLTTLLGYLLMLTHVFFGNVYKFDKFVSLLCIFREAYSKDLTISPGQML